MSLNITSAKKIRKLKNKWKNLPPEEQIKKEKALQEEIGDELEQPQIRGFVHVVAGTVKNFKLAIPPQAKPITNRMKISLFDLLREDILKKNVLDLYAGSGALGIEALSRGAKHCTFVDNSAFAFKIITDNLKKTGFLDQSEVIKMKVNAYLSEIPSDQYFDIIFMDPPYKDFKYKRFQRLIDTIDLASEHLIGFNPEFKGEFKGTIIIKHPTDVKFEEVEFTKMEWLVTYKYGRNSLTFLVVEGYGSKPKNKSLQSQ